MLKITDDKHKTTRRIWSDTADGVAFLTKSAEACCERFPQAWGNRFNVKWFGGTLKQAVGELKTGNAETAKRIATVSEDIGRELMKTGPRKRARRSVHGHRPNVPAVCRDERRTMFKRVRRPHVVPVRRIFVDLASQHNFDPATIELRGAIACALIRTLALKSRVELYVVNGSEINGWNHILGGPIDTNPLDISTIAALISAKSYRRLFLGTKRWMEYLRTDEDLVSDPNQYIMLLPPQTLLGLEPLDGDVVVPRLLGFDSERAQMIADPVAWIRSKQ